MVPYRDLVAVEDSHFRTHPRAGNPVHVFCARYFKIIASYKYSTTFALRRGILYPILDGVVSFKSLAD